MALHEDGGYASNIGRPLGSIYVEPSYGVSFFNRMVDKPLDEVQLISKVPFLYTYKVDLGSTNFEYSRFLHFSITNGVTGTEIQPQAFVPYIDSTKIVGDSTEFTVKPLVEVVNPNFVKIADNLFAMYFYSSFTTSPLPESDAYTDDPKYLRRLVEFATNTPNELADIPSPSPYDSPYANDRNYYDQSVLEDKTPRMAYLSCLLRVVPLTVNSSASSTSSGDKLYIIAEKPKIITWVGHRFALDTHPPLLVNKTQCVEWKSNKAASNEITRQEIDSASKNPLTHIPYNHIISKIKTTMYAGYSGIDVYTRPIHEIYDMALDHMFEVNGTKTRTFNMYDNGRKLSSIGIIQKNIKSFGDSDFTPFERHFAIVQIGMEDFRKFSSSSSSSTAGPEYLVDIPIIRYDYYPDYWDYYIEKCDVPSVDRKITVKSINDQVWYGTKCLDKIQFYAKIEGRPFGTWGEEIYRYRLTFGPCTTNGDELDIIWQGYKLSGKDVAGDYGMSYTFWVQTIAEFPTKIEVKKA